MKELPLDYTSFSKHKSQLYRRQRISKMMKIIGIIVMLTIILLVLLIKGNQLQQRSMSFGLWKSSSSSKEAMSSYQKKKKKKKPYHYYDDEEKNHYTHDEGQISSSIFRPIVISGPSGVGKGTLIHKLITYYNEKSDEIISSHEVIDNTNKIDHDNDGIFGFSISHTTRAPRPGETNGVDYHFTNRDEMMKRIQNHEFIEYAEVHGNIYGTSSAAVQKVISSQRICILDIDVQGARQVKENSLLLTPHFVFIAPPSMEALEQRLRDRNTETEEAILRRIGNARKEVEYGTYAGNFDYIVVNDDLEIAFQQLRQILEEWYPYLTQISTPRNEFL